MHSNSNSDLIPVMLTPTASDYEYHFIDITGEEIVEYKKCEYIDLTESDSENSNSSSTIDENPEVLFNSPELQNSDNIPATGDYGDVEMINHIKSEETELMEDDECDPGNSMPIELEKSNIKTEKDNIWATYKRDCSAEFCDKFLHLGHIIRFTCNICGHTFQTQEEMNRHIIYNHTVHCWFCGKYISYKELNMHNTIFHPEQVEQRRILNKKRHSERNKLRQEMTRFAHQVSQFQWGMDNLYKQKNRCYRKKAKNKCLYRKYNNIVTPSKVQIEPKAEIMNVKLEPNLVNVKIEPTFNYVTVKTEPQW